MKFLEKIRNLPERTRKIILWVALIVLALIMLIWWVGRIPERLDNLQVNLPKITIPQISNLPDEEIQKIKDSLNNIETNAPEEAQIQEN